MCDLLHIPDDTGNYQKAKIRKAPKLNKVLVSFVYAFEKVFKIVIMLKSQLFQ